jgi:hypothetical protein
VEIQYHPAAEMWLAEFASDEELIDVFGEIMALITALERYGRSLEGEETSPIVSSRFDMHELRRTPPSETLPYADSPPVIRVLYAFCQRQTADPVAVILLGGDKADLGEDWYLSNVPVSERRLEEFVRRNNELKPLGRRST